MKIKPDSIDLDKLLNPSSKEPQVCCGQLRCKTMYYRPDERPGKLHESDTAMHWCILTQQPIGPDNKEAKPSLCQAGRACFKSQSL